MGFIDEGTCRLRFDARQAYVETSLKGKGISGLSNIDFCIDRAILRKTDLPLARRDGDRTKEAG